MTKLLFIIPNFLIWLIPWDSANEVNVKRFMGCSALIALIVCLLFPSSFCAGPFLAISKTYKLIKNYHINNTSGKPWVIANEN
jgi:hypothetical protein